jgi:hypothetical protein
MRVRSAVWVGLLFLVTASLGLAATNAEMYFSSDKNGQNRVANVQEGTSVWIVVHDPDENIDCDVRDKLWTDVKIMDPKTGAYIVWVSYADATGSPTGHPYDDAGYVPYKGHFPGNPGWLGADYLEETGADTGLFVSSRSFQIGTREDYGDPVANTHVVSNRLGYLGIDGLPYGFQWGHYDYSDEEFDADEWSFYADARVGFRPRPSNDLDLDGEYDWEAGHGLMSRGELPAWMPSESFDYDQGLPDGYLLGRFENMDTLIGMYQDPNDPTDVATAMMKIIDTQSTIAWDQEIYKDANGAATITVVDPDENLNCSAVEYVPVFVLVNPGSWNPIPIGEHDPSASDQKSPNDFSMLLQLSGVIPDGSDDGPSIDRQIEWFSIYDSGLRVGDQFTWGPAGGGTANINNDQLREDGTYFVQYPVEGIHDNVTYFDTTDGYGFCRVMFFAQETGPNTGVFQLNLNSILVDLGFDSLRVRDVLVAYYIDPNDFDDLSLATARIESKETSITTFTDATRQDKKVFWIGRDPVYVQVIDANANVDPCCPEQVVVFVCDPHGEDDAEWLVLDETTSNTPVFFANSGTELLPVWDAQGLGGVDAYGGYQLQLDNWRLEVFNEDAVYVRYNDVYYTSGADGLLGLGDGDLDTAFPPKIDRVRVANDVSFDVMSIGDTQVVNGQTVNMYFLDRQGNRVSGYVNSDCAFIEVVDPDQNEDVLRRERVDAYWDEGQNWPFGPLAENGWNCGPVGNGAHSINILLGDTDIFNSAPEPLGEGAPAPAPKVYILNPRSGFWAAVDLLETGVATGDFVSVICVDLVNVATCVPTLGALPGDTIVAFYQDPSNHSDSAMIQVKVGMGGGGTPPSQASTTTFTNATGAAVANYTDADLVYVKVVDPSHSGATTLQSALTINGQAFSLAPAAGMPADTFMTAGMDLNLAAGATITATYVDPTDPTDTSSDTIAVIAGTLDVTSFYAGPSPSAGDVTFGYNGTGVASMMSVEVYDLAGRLVWASELANVTQIVWSPATGDRPAANGCYIYLVTATDGTKASSGKGTVFIRR